MKLSKELLWRGFVNQTTFKSLEELDGEPISFYFGVDPSADSMTIGNFAAAMMTRHFIDAGHKAFLLVGGATGMVGDPDGKKDELSIKTLDQIAKNKAGIAAEYRRIFADQEFQLVDNFDWFKDINYLSFLREVGKHVPMSQMLDREFIRSRLGENGTGISYAEFSYALIQGYDFLHLFREHGVTLQICGADQWGNSIAGVELIRRIENGEAHVYSTPLIINKATGVKFGKSEAGAIWLNEEKTSVYKFYQFFLNVDDEGAIDYAKIYTLLSREEMQKIADEHSAQPGSRIAQKALAFETTKIVHGEARALSARKVSEVLFGEKEFTELSPQEIDVLAAEIPVFEKGKMVIDVLNESGLVKSNGEARRLIESGAVSINGKKIDSDKKIEVPSLLKKGKNAFILIR